MARWGKKTGKFVEQPSPKVEVPKLQLEDPPGNYTVIIKPVGENASTYAQVEDYEILPGYLMILIGGHRLYFVSENHDWFDIYFRGD